MNPCIDNCCPIFCFGQFDCGEEIVLPILAGDTGEYKLRQVSTGGQINYIHARITSGDPLTFPNMFNEDQDIKFTIINPDHTSYIYNVDDVNYCMFLIQNRVANDITLGEIATNDGIDSSCNAYREVLDLVEGNNIILHNLEVPRPYAVFVELRYADSGSKIEFVKVMGSETTNSIRISLNEAIANVEVTVIR